VARAALPDRFRAELDRAGILTGPALVLVAVSGGPDSLALLDLLAGLAPARALRLCVVHADHGILKDSGRIAAGVARLAGERYGVEAIVERLELGAGAGETRARAARYRFFRRVQAEREARWLATAHHADDQIETVLLRLLKGSAPAGLAGMPAVGPGGLVRPLLPFRHDELVAQVRSAGLEAFDDPANTDPRHMRSWVRTTLLPVLTQRVGDAAADNLLRVAGHAADEVAAWDAVLDALPTLEVHARQGGFDVARTALDGYDSLLAARLIRAAAHRSGLMLGPAQAARVARFAARADSGKTLDLGEAMLAEIGFDRLLVYRRPPSPAALLLAGEAGEQSFGDFRLTWRTEPAPERLDRGGWTTWIQPGTLEVQQPATGSRLVPLRGTGHRAVSRLLMEERVPRGDRAAWPLVLRDGEPIWIPGVCRANAAIPVPGTNAVRVDVAAR
jgi:tRNA(Ile)-lysidine synthase